MEAYFYSEGKIVFIEFEQMHDLFVIKFTNNAVEMFPLKENFADLCVE